MHAALLAEMDRCGTHLPVEPSEALV
jgi:hypothetical protein